MKRDFQLFINYAKENISENNRIQIEQEYAREIVEGYQEALFKITQTYGTIGNIVYSTNSKLKIITKNNRIIFFNLEGKEIRNFPENKETTNDTTYQFSDQIKMNDLKKKFKEDYKAALVEEELFIDTIAVGIKCGHYPGETTKEQTQILKWVQAKDSISLFQWLQSVNSEKQVYAVKGLYYLSLKGITISEEKKRIVEKIRRKKGTIYTCIPCDASKSPIQEVLKPFMF
ncbi:hypothetical protein L0U88_18835 [Flavihumibacter sp. RY-1]|uniref:Uncharacterized protein n=1 Tax=Flavihumibacter fluminis TaxID=2909236 RepID=A0ABS9BM51_9BACT|nr:hypothetical protein [Flavihumibacter fluminis]MCF1716705.1 hypothetical protein [Flavihumibacter fluminis]